MISDTANFLSVLPLNHANYKITVMVAWLSGKTLIKLNFYSLSVMMEQQLAEWGIRSLDYDSIMIVGNDVCKYVIGFQRSGHPGYEDLSAWCFVILRNRRTSYKVYIDLNRNRMMLRYLKGSTEYHYKTIKYRKTKDLAALSRKIVHHVEANNIQY